MRKLVGSDAQYDESIIDFFFFLCNVQISQEIKLARCLLQQLKKSAEALIKRKENYCQILSKVEKKKSAGYFPQLMVKVNKF